MSTQHQFLDVTDRRISIELPQSFVNRRVEVIVRTVDELAAETTSGVRRRRPDPEIAGKGRTLGDLVSPIVSEEDWDCLK
jgi:hypothetical protein